MRECKHCAGEIADSAAICPHCGGKNPTTLGAIRAVLTMMFAAGMCVMMYSCIMGFDQAGKSLAEAERVMARQELATAEAALRKAVEPQLAESNRLAEIAAERAEIAAEREKGAEVLAKQKAEAEAAKDTDADRRAIRALKLRIESGSVAAKYSLAVRYLDGNGVKKDEAKARKMLRECAEAGHVMAAKRLKKMQ